MKIAITRLGIGAACALAAFTLAGTVQAQAPAPQPGPSARKHDSNTLHKIGNAIQYPVRKATNNLSVDIHRAEGKNSVVRRHHGSVAYNAEVKPSGRIVTRHPIYAHRRRHSKLWWRWHRHHQLRK
jgi:hypothetical protein